MNRFHLILALACGCVARGVLPARPIPESKVEDARETASTVGTEQPASADEWPSFRGDLALTGHRPEKISDAPRLLWTFDTGSSTESTAAVVGSRAYLGLSDGFVIALELDPDSKDGKLAWRFEAEGRVRSSPAVARVGGDATEGAVTAGDVTAERVWFGDDAGWFFCLDARTGKEIWKFDAGGAEIVSSAAYFEGKVIFGGYDGSLHALDAKSGEVAWRVETGGPIHSSPPIVAGKTCVTGCDEILRVIDVHKGVQIAEMPLGSYSQASPAVVGDVAYVGTFANEFVAFDLARVERRWVFEPDRDLPFVSSPAVAGDRVVFGGRDREIRCLDRGTGVEIWTFPTRARVDCSPVIAGDRVICGSSDKNLYLLDLADGRKVWEFASDGAFLSSPALASGRLVIATESGLVHCFDVRPTGKPASGK